MRPKNPKVSCRNAPAFTLVELMMVITIVVLLASILVPALEAARTAARQTATSSLLHSIGTGLDMFQAEPRLGRRYPNSCWDASVDGTPYGASTENRFYYGAQTLLWGLAGADLLGTPGFQADADTPMSNGNDGLYELDDGQPVKPRFGPFIDLSKTEIKTPQELGISVGSSPGGTPADPNGPVIVDSFNRPVLYYRAEPECECEIQDVYPTFHNEGFLDETLLPNGQRQDPIANETAFYRYIVDQRAQNLTGVVTPHNRDRFLLITPGPDKRYGTADDIANFQFNVEQ